VFKLFRKKNSAINGVFGNRTDYFMNLHEGIRPNENWRESLSPLLAEAWPQWSQGFEELIIRDFFQDAKNLFYVDIGCAWPDRSSTSCFLEKKLKWTGIACDALGEYEKDWCRQRPNTTFCNYAVTDQTGIKLVFYRHEWTGVSSTLKEIASRHGGEEKLTEVTATSITINSLLNQNNIHHIDHLTLDIEGAEYQALQGFDIQKFSPRLCCIEAANDKIIDYFSSNNYQLIEHYKNVDKINWYFCPK